MKRIIILLVAVAAVLLPDAASAQFNLSGVLNGATLSCSGYVKMEGGKLVALVDATEALAAFKTANPENANHQLLQSVSAVAQQFSGIYGAAAFTK